MRPMKTPCPVTKFHDKPPSVGRRPSPRRPFPAASLATMIKAAGKKIIAAAMRAADVVAIAAAKRRRTFAIHTVFIAKENILFMEEWLDYHMQLGFTKFYLYDNSKSAGLGEWYRERMTPASFNNIVPGKVNKHRINYHERVDMSNGQVADLLRRIADKYRDHVALIEWSPLDDNGAVTYGQLEAHTDCLARMKKERVDWCANIDMDEFIVLGKHGDIGACVASLDRGVGNIRMSQIQFRNRFADMEALVIDADRGVELGRGRACKNIYRVAKTRQLLVHEWRGKGEQWLCDVDEVCFNHYVRNKLDMTAPFCNIAPRLKEAVRRNSVGYLRAAAGRRYRHGPTRPRC